MLFNSPEGSSIIQELKIAEVPTGSITNYWLHIVTDGMGVPVYIPVIVAKGKLPGKTLGLTAAVHGNELNGIPVIQKLFKELDIKNLRGTLVGIPVVNSPALLRKKRRFIDGTDLNHIMPGKSNGNVSEVYAWRFTQRVLREFNYLIDLHTASNGRINSYYIRADMANETVRKMALLQNPQIIVHNPPNDGTLRGAAAELNIPAITLEVGNPNIFQKGIIKDGYRGLQNVLGYLDFIPHQPEQASEAIIICKHSYWLYTDTGGILTVFPKITQRIQKGELIAEISNIFGHLIRSYYAPEDGVVIGKSVNPVNQTGGRILHLGIE